MEEVWRETKKMSLKECVPMIETFGRGSLHLSEVFWRQSDWKGVIKELKGGGDIFELIEESSPDNDEQSLESDKDGLHDKSKKSLRNKKKKEAKKRKMKEIKSSSTELIEETNINETEAVVLNPMDFLTKEDIFLQQMRDVYFDFAKEKGMNTEQINDHEDIDKQVYDIWCSSSQEIQVFIEFIVCKIKFSIDGGDKSYEGVKFARGDDGTFMVGKEYQNIEQYVCFQLSQQTTSDTILGYVDEKISHSSESSSEESSKSSSEESSESSSEKSSESSINSADDKTIVIPLECFEFVDLHKVLEKYSNIIIREKKKTKK